MPDTGSAKKLGESTHQSLNDDEMIRGVDLGSSSNFSGDVQIEKYNDSTNQVNID